MRQFVLPLSIVFVFTLVPLPARAAFIEAVAFLDGPSEFPPNASPGTGFASIVFDTTAHTLFVSAAFEGLIGTTTAAHIHARVSPSASPPTAGVATTVPTFTGFPLGVTSGTYSHLFDTSLASSFNPSFVTANGGTVAAAESALFDAIQAGEAYFNIHSTVFPGGEIRGFLQPVPEPSSLVLLGSGVVVLWGCRRRRLRQQS